MFVFLPVPRSFRHRSSTVAKRPWWKSKGTLSFTPYSFRLPLFHSFLSPSIPPSPFRVPTSNSPSAPGSPHRNNKGCNVIRMPEMGVLDLGRMREGRRNGERGMRIMDCGMRSVEDGRAECGELNAECGSEETVLTSAFRVPTLKGVPPSAFRLEQVFRVPRSDFRIQSRVPPSDFVQSRTISATDLTPILRITRPISVGATMRGNRRANARRSDRAVSHRRRSAEHGSEDIGRERWRGR